MKITQFQQDRKAETISFFALSLGSAAIHFSTQNVITACTPFSAIISKYFDFVLSYMFLSFLLCRLGWTDLKWVSSAVFYDGLSKTLAQLSSVLVKLYRLFLFDQWFYYFKHVNSNAGYTLCRWRCQGCMRCVWGREDVSFQGRLWNEIKPIGTDEKKCVLLLNKIVQV